MIKTIFKAIGSYLGNWKNLLTHAVIGLALLLFALKAPLPALWRMVVLLAVIVLNILRSRHERKKKENPAGEREDIR